MWYILQSSICIFVNSIIILFTLSLTGLQVSVLGLERALHQYTLEPSETPFNIKTVPLDTQPTQEQKGTLTSKTIMLIRNIYMKIYQLINPKFWIVIFICFPYWHVWLACSLYQNTGEHRYNTIVGVQWVKSCYKWIVLYKKINQKTIPKTDE